MPRRRRWKHQSEYWHVPAPIEGAVHLHINRRLNGDHVWCVVDAEDAPRVMEHKWSETTMLKPYVYCKTMVPSNWKMLHRFVMRAPVDKLVDHINGDPLDNRKSNLRYATPQQNSWNKAAADPRLMTSRFKGVSRRGATWIAQLSKSGEVVFYDTFATEFEAARAYDEAAKRHFGEFARTNEAQGLFDLQDA